MPGSTRANVSVATVSLVANGKAAGRARDSTGAEPAVTAVLDGQARVGLEPGEGVDS